MFFENKGEVLIIDFREGKKMCLVWGRLNIGCLLSCLEGFCSFLGVLFGG